MRLTLFARLMTAATILLAACSEDSQPGVIGIDATVDRGPDIITAYDTGSEDARRGCGLVTCESAGATCGPVGDGCGGIINCGTCAAPQTCGGGGMPSRCGGTSGCTRAPARWRAPTAAPCPTGAAGSSSAAPARRDSTCGGGGTSQRLRRLRRDLRRGRRVRATHLRDGGRRLRPRERRLRRAVDVRHLRGSADLRRRRNSRPVRRQRARASRAPAPRRGANCGPVSDGCGGLLMCGTCAAGTTCGGGGRPSQCGARGATTCVPRTCAAPRRQLRPRLRWLRRAAHVRDLPGGHRPAAAAAAPACAAPAAIARRRDRVRATHLRGRRRELRPRGRRMRRTALVRDLRLRDRPAAAVAVRACAARADLPTRGPCACVAPARASARTAARSRMAAADC